MQAPLTTSSAPCAHQGGLHHVWERADLLNGPVASWLFDLPMSVLTCTASSYPPAAVICKGSGTGVGLTGALNPHRPTEGTYSIFKEPLQTLAVPTASLRTP